MIAMDHRETLVAGLIHDRRIISARGFECGAELVGGACRQVAVARAWPHKPAALRRARSQSFTVDVNSPTRVALAQRAGSCGGRPSPLSRFSKYVNNTMYARNDYITVSSRRARCLPMRWVDQHEATHEDYV
jgi:hypothetical protein